MSSVRADCIRVGTAATMEMVLDVAEHVTAYYPPERFLSRWFRDAEVTAILKENVRELLAWAGYAKELASLTHEQLQTLEAPVS
jgi:predicted RNA-binding Zn ribbon-like protein